MYKNFKKGVYLEIEFSIIVPVSSDHQRLIGWTHIGGVSVGGTENTELMSL